MDTKIKAKEQSIKLSSVGNARELGGYKTMDGRTVKHGMLLRTAAINNISDDDIKILVKDYNLSVVVDFRMKMEAKSNPDPEIPGVKNCHFSIIDENSFKMFEKDGMTVNMKPKTPEEQFKMLKYGFELGMVGEKMYINFLKAIPGIEGYKAFFRELINLSKDSSILFHCTQGKDRTGLAAMLILAVLDVSEDTIIEDYTFTNVFNAGLIEKEHMFLKSMGLEGEELRKFMIAMDEVSPGTMINVINWMKDNYGSIKEYVINVLEISGDEIAELKNKFTE
ncbi:MAG: tyrosine-protein phosphatase [Lachnospiraceae bacterium]|nr:tyrosine-protein phosphatase [Lachnospiraceae bacterium]